MYAMFNAQRYFFCTSYSLHDRRIAIPHVCVCVCVCVMFVYFPYHKAAGRPINMRAASSDVRSLRMYASSHSTYAMMMVQCDLMQYTVQIHVNGVDTHTRNRVEYILHKSTRSLIIRAPVQLSLLHPHLTPWCTASHIYAATLYALTYNKNGCLAVIFEMICDMRGARVEWCTMC